jgi:hypothetical protein
MRPNCEPLKAYLRDYPQSPHVAEVKSALETATRLAAETDRREQQSRDAAGRQLHEELEQVLVDCQRRFGDDRPAFDACVRQAITF